MKYVIYAKPACHYCVQAIIALEKTNHTYDYKSLDEDFTREELLAKFPNAKTFPQIETETGQYIGGFNELKEHLNAS